MIDGISAPAMPTSGAGAVKPKSTAEAAQQFESLLIAQMLKSAREVSGGGWMGTGDDQAGMPAVEMAEEQFASLLSAQGGLGLAKMVANGVSKQAAAEQERQGQQAVGAPVAKAS